jgi:hypothetical protein
MIFTHCTHSQSKSRTQTCSQASKQPKKDQPRLSFATHTQQVPSLTCTLSLIHAHTNFDMAHIPCTTHTHKHTQTHLNIQHTLEKSCYLLHKKNRSAQKHSSCARAHAHTPPLDIHTSACTHHRTHTHTPGHGAEPYSPHESAYLLTSQGNPHEKISNISHSLNKHVHALFHKHAHTDMYTQTQLNTTPGRLKNLLASHLSHICHTRTRAQTSHTWDTC